MTKKAKDSELEKLKFNLEQYLDNGIDFENRVIRVTGAIGDPEGSSDYFDFNLLDYALTTMESQSSDPVTLRIHSPGGNCYDALAIIGRIKASKCQIITEAYGHAMSAATLILMAGDVRKMSAYCVPMFHKISFGTGGDLDSIEETVAQTKKEQLRWARYYEEFSKKSATFWMGKMKKTEFYPTPEQMLDYGAIDEVI